MPPSRFEVHGDAPSVEPLNASPTQHHLRMLFADISKYGLLGVDVPEVLVLDHIAHDFGTQLGDATAGPALLRLQPAHPQILLHPHALEERPDAGTHRLDLTSCLPDSLKPHVDRRGRLDGACGF